MPRCFRDDEEAGEDAVEEEVGSGDGRGPSRGLDSFQSLPAQRVDEAAGQGAGRFEGAVGAPRVAEGEDVGVRQDPRCARILGGPASNVPGAVGQENGSWRRCWIGPRQGVPGGRAPAVNMEGAQCLVDKESLDCCAGGESRVRQGRIRFPWCPVGRCSPDVDGRGWEDAAGVMECGFDEAERGRAGPDRLVDPVGSLIGEDGGSQVGICADCGSSVGGDGNLGDDADIARRCKVDEVANVGV